MSGAYQAPVPAKCHPPPTSPIDTSSTPSGTTYHARAPVNVNTASPRHSASLMSPVVKTAEPAGQGMGVSGSVGQYEPAGHTTSAVTRVREV